MDLFISYSHSDRAFVERLARDLVKHGVTVWYDQWELSLGDSLRQKISAGIDRAAFLGVILSKSSVESKWVKDELFAAMAMGSDENRVVVLPLLIEDCTVPALLRDKVYTDFRKGYDQGLRELVQRVKVADASQLGRLRRDGVTSDYGFDWGEDNHGRPRYRVFIVTHSDSLPASFLCTIYIEPNERMSARIREYEAKGFSSMARILIAMLMAQTFKSDTRLFIDDELPATMTVENIDPKLGVGCTFHVEARRLGEPSDKAVLYYVGQTVLDVAELIAKNAKAESSDRDAKRYLEFIKKAPL